MPDFFEIPDQPDQPRDGGGLWWIVTLGVCLAVAVGAMLFVLHSLPGPSPVTRTVPPWMRPHTQHHVVSPSPASPSPVPTCIDIVAGQAAERTMHDDLNVVLHDQTDPLAADYDKTKHMRQIAYDITGMIEAGQADPAIVAPLKEAQNWWMKASQDFYLSRPPAVVSHDIAMAAAAIRKSSKAVEASTVPRC